MARYDEIYSALAERAVRIGAINVETFIQQGLAARIPRERLLEMLEEDLDNDGPIFGQFMRSLVGATTTSVAAAARQGEVIGAVSADATMKKLLGLAGGEGESVIARALESADPELAAEIEDAAADALEVTWVAELRNTCHLCLPLHGQTLTLAEWKELGLHPDTIHPGNWTSVCHCRLVPRTAIKNAETLKAPLIRLKLEKGKRTARSVTQKDIERSLAARDAAAQSVEGRRTLRQLGKARGGLAIATKDDVRKWLRLKLSFEEQKAVRAWKGSSYSDIRRADLGEPTKHDGTPRVRDDLAKALRSAPLYEGEIWRGLSNVPPEVAARFAPGNEFVDQAHASWTPARKLAEDFATADPGTVAILIRIRQNSGGKYIDAGEEPEVVKRPGHRGRIKSARWTLKPGTRTRMLIVEVEE